MRWRQDSSPIRTGISLKDDEANVLRVEHLLLSECRSMASAACKRHGKARPAGWETDLVAYSDIDALCFGRGQR